MRKITKTIYICEACGQQSENKDEIQRCEWRHMGITDKEIGEQYTQLHKEVADAISHNQYTNDKETRQAVDDAINAEIAFEEQHGITPLEDILKQRGC